MKPEDMETTAIGLGIAGTVVAAARWVVGWNWKVAAEQSALRADLIQLQQQHDVCRADRQHDEGVLFAKVDDVATALRGVGEAITRVEGYLEGQRRNSNSKV